MGDTSAVAQVTSLTMRKHHSMNEDKVPKCCAKYCCPLHLFWTCGRGMITFCIIAKSWEVKSEMLKHCVYQDLRLLRSVVCSLEQINKKLLWNHVMLLVTTGWGEQRTVLSRLQTFLSLEFLALREPSRRGSEISSNFSVFLPQPNFLIHIVAFVVIKDMN